MNIDKLPDIYISSIKNDSRLVKKGDLFIALKGYYLNGRDFIKEAINKGAICVLTYSNINKNYYIYNIKYKVYFFYILNLDIYLSDISGFFYDHPSKKMLLLGVTGTNGKTTIVNISSYWVYLLGYKSAILSTIGNGFINNLYSSLNTTESAINIQRWLYHFYKKFCKFVSIEVSSHALIQNRVKSLYFSSVVFTNLTLDHLDFHLNFKKYELAKWKLFSEFNVKNLVINIDDYIGFKWFRNISNKYVIPVTFNKEYIIYFKYRWLLIKKIEVYGFLKKIYFNSFWGNHVLNVFLLGKFNIMNIILSFVSLLSLGFNILDLINVSKYLYLPIGRMELFIKKKKPLVIIDYAHTPDAFKNILLETKKFCLGKLWCIFGCTGNRDKSKRSLIGYLVKKYSDYVIITNDDLYNEDENSILNDIKLGINDYNDVYIILDRVLAIKFSLQNANSKDTILILGKGHENFIFLKKNKIIYSDRNLVNKILG